MEGQQQVDDGNTMEEVGQSRAVAAAEDFNAERECEANDREDAGAQVVQVPVQW